MSAIAMERFPWWYRGRTLVFSAIYFAGFFAGSFASFAVYHAYIPAYREIGARFGPNGAAAVLGFAAACAALCYVLRVWGSSYLRAGVVWNAEARTDSLIVAGPFRYLRNPLYLGSLFMAIGVGLLAPVLGFAIIVLANSILIAALARHEESVLDRAYGSRFRDYAARVPSMIPRLFPIAAESDVRPSLAQGVLAEVFTAALLIGIVLGFLDRQHGPLEFFILYAAGIVAQRFIARAQRAA